MGLKEKQWWVPWFFSLPYISQTVYWGKEQPRNTNENLQKCPKKSLFSLAKGQEKGHLTRQKRQKTLWQLYSSQTQEKKMITPERPNQRPGLLSFPRCKRHPNLPWQGGVKESWVGCLDLYPHMMIMMHTYCFPLGWYQRMTRVDKTFITIQQ